MGKRFNGRVRAGCIGVFFSFGLLAASSGALAEPPILASGGLPQPDPAIAIPAGSTLVPSRAEFEKSLGIAPAADASPQAMAGVACQPDTGTPTTSPSSADIAIGPSKGVIVTNEGYKVFDTSTPSGCATGSLTSLKTFFSSLAPAGTETLFSPRVAYNPALGRFMIIALATDTASTDKYLYRAISTDNTASSWAFYRSVPSNDVGETLSPPTLGFSAGRWLAVVTITGTTNRSLLYNFDPASPGIYYTTVNPTLNLVAPRILDSSTTAYFLAIGGSTSVTRVPYDVTTDIASTATSITIPAFTAPPAVTQKNGKTLNAGDGNFLSPSIQIGNSLWNVHTVNVDGHARARLYKFSTTGTTPLMTFTPTVLGTEDIFNAAMTTGSEAAGSRAFISATLVASSQVGQYLMAFSGPNDSTQGWSYDFGSVLVYDFATTDGATACPPTGCAWIQSSGAAMVPGDTTKAWVFNQGAKGTKQTDWGVAGFAVSGDGTGYPPLGADRQRRDERHRDRLHRQLVRAAARRRLPARRFDRPGVRKFRIRLPGQGRRQRHLVRRHRPFVRDGVLLSRPRGRERHQPQLEHHQRHHQRRPTAQQPAAKRQDRHRPLRTSRSVAAGARWIGGSSPLGLRTRGPRGGGLWRRVRAMPNQGRLLPKKALAEAA